MPKLSALSIKNLSAPGKYPDGDGLYLVVNSPTSKSWVFRYSIRGARREMGLGSSDDLPLSDARRKCHDFRRMVLDGSDPIHTRTVARLSKSDLTFEAVSREYLRKIRHAWKSEKHSRNWINSLESYVFPIIGGVSVADVTLEMVVRVFEPIWYSKTETANRTLNRVSKILGYARVMKYRTGENPASWKDNIEHVFPAKSQIHKVSPMPAMSYEAVQDFYAEILQEESVSALCLRFQMLTATRTIEATGARWAEINWEDKSWTIPGTRMKMGKEHRVPLSDQALELLKACKAMSRCEFIFPSRMTGKHLSGMSLVVYMRKMGRSEVPHGFRSTFKDWAAECTDHRNELSEMALAHKISNEVEAAYRRGDLFEKRRTLMKDWADFCSGSNKN